MDCDIVLGIYEMHPPLRRPGILRLGESIRVVLPEGILDIFLAVYVDRVSLYEIESSDVIQPSGMVFMIVCQQYGIKMPDSLTEHLVTEIRAGVDQYRQSAVFNQRG